MASAQHELLVKKVRNEWKVVSSQDETKTQIRAKRGDRISIQAEGSDIYFQFMDSKLFGDYTRVLKKGQQVVLNISRLAKVGSHRYAAFCLEDKVFATGESPPVIIVE